jgi:hypothetical protein
VGSNEVAISAGGDAGQMGEVAMKRAWAARLVAALVLPADVNASPTRFNR